VKPVPHDKGRTSPVIFVSHFFTGSSGSQVFENVQKQENPIGGTLKERPTMAFSRSTCLLSGHTRGFWQGPLSHLRFEMGDSQYKCTMVKKIE
jgi:hypothetical protein